MDPSWHITSAQLARSPRSPELLPGIGGSRLGFPQEGKKEEGKRQQRAGGEVTPDLTESSSGPKHTPPIPAVD